MWTAWVVVAAILPSGVWTDGGYGAPPRPSFGAPFASSYPPPAPSYAPAPVLAPAYPVAIHQDYDDYDSGGGLGNFFDSLGKGLTKGLGLDGDKGKAKKAKVVHVAIPQPVYQPPQTVHVQVPKCEPHTHYVTNIVSEKVPVPVTQTEFVERVVPSVVYKTHVQTQIQTEWVTSVLTQRLTSTLTKTLVVPRTSYATQTVTSVATNNVFERTTEVSFTPVLRTRAVTVTQTEVRVDKVPDIQYTTVDRTRLVPTTVIVTETQIQLQPSLVYETKYFTETQLSTQYVPTISTVVSTAYQHTTTSLYVPGPVVGQGAPVTITSQVKEYVPKLKTHYVTTTAINKQYITNTAYRTHYVTTTNYLVSTAYRTQYVTSTAIQQQYITSTAYKNQYITTTAYRKQYVTVAPNCPAPQAPGYNYNPPGYDSHQTGTTVSRLPGKEINYG